jgi:hypothetical protein
MALPQLTPEQRQEALKKAAEARAARSAVMSGIREGKTKVTDLLKKDDPVVGKIKVKALLNAVPGYGKVTVGKLMDELGISETRRVQGLGSKQKEALIAKLS